MKCCSPEETYQIRSLALKIRERKKGLSSTRMSFFQTCGLNLNKTKTPKDPWLLPAAITEPIAAWALLIDRCAVPADQGLEVTLSLIFRVRCCQKLSASHLGQLHFQEPTVHLYEYKTIWHLQWTSVGSITFTKVVTSVLYSLKFRKCHFI